ncbi:hypothetical protein AV521_18535 [Streptomyces sp. IMTB 2501]|uniref:hypothetical protein n=1 Tax=Streptomyces sp. IMTB 2501 TaxID=1776340 RepID=UPI000970023A|nr:hypothetical protein [Streptomyces sp. IMTB 2501]OLZ69506.1 hypothetical protein AV521_18535 [Streptomyces sp. IMTB 2501]
MTSLLAPFKRAVAGAATATMALMMAMAPAAAAAPAHVHTAAAAESAQACGSKFPLYSEGRWTYTEARFCLSTDGQQVHPVLEFSECQYYWGAAWYYAKAKYPCGFDFAYTVTRDGQDVLDGSSSGSGGPSGTVEGNSTACAGPGNYTLRARYVLSGPYWTDVQINSGYRTYNLELPCT